MESQPDHHAGITDFIARLNAKARLSRDYDVRFLLPTARSQITYSYDDKNYVLMPDASFQLAFKGDWHTYFLEFERRATTLRRSRGGQSPTFDYSTALCRRDHRGMATGASFVSSRQCQHIPNFHVSTRNSHGPHFSAQPQDLPQTRTLAPH